MTVALPNLRFRAGTAGGWIATCDDPSGACWPDGPSKGQPYIVESFGETKLKAEERLRAYLVINESGSEQRMSSDREKRRRRRQFLGTHDLQGNPLDQMGVVSEPHAAAIDQMLPQLLIALVKRAGGRLVVPVKEVDDTDNDMLAFKVDPEKREFTFTITHPFVEAKHENRDADELGGVSAFGSGACCWACATEQQRQQLFIACGECGNERCPKATNHLLACTRSNEPGQKGSRFELCKP